VNTASVDKAPWVISAADQPPALEIVLLRHTVVLSWSQFVYAEGGDDEVQIAFASHDVVVKGGGLGPLLREIAAHRVVRIQESGRSEHFPGQVGRFTRGIVVRKMEAE
jgi:hypothetical protein